MNDIRLTPKEIQATGDGVWVDGCLACASRVSDAQIRKVVEYVEKHGVTDASSNIIISAEAWAELKEAAGDKP